MTKHNKTMELVNLLLLALKKRPDLHILDQQWEDQVMDKILEQDIPAAYVQPAGEVSLKTYVPSLSTFGALAAGLTLIACYKLDAIDAHVLKATVETTYIIFQPP